MTEYEMVKKTQIMLITVFLFLACESRHEINPVDLFSQEKRTVDLPLKDSLRQGTTYLSVYSQIYGQTERRTHDLTATVSIRNVNRSDTIYIQKAEYFDTKGKLIRSYFDKAIFIAPLETVEIVINEIDREGGTGANFLFDWKVRQISNDPFFECVMISMYGQQGLSFTTQGKRIE